MMSLGDKIPDRFFEGAEKFFGANVGKDTSDGSYKDWYDDLSKSMVDRKQYVNEKFVLIRKDVKQYDDWLLFISKRKGHQWNEGMSHIVVEGLYERLKDAKVFLLHPNDVKKGLKMARSLPNRVDNVIAWYHYNPSKDFYFGNSYSVIMLAELK